MENIDKLENAKVQELKSTSKSSRNSTIEILRIISMFFIVLSHCCLHGGASTFGNDSIRTFTCFILPLGKIFFCVFAIISCWYLIDCKCKSSRFFKLWISTFLYGIIFLIIKICVDGSNSVSTKTMIKSFFPMFGFGISHGYIAGFLFFLLILPLIKIMYSKFNYKAIAIISIFLILCNQYTCFVSKTVDLISEFFAFFAIFSIVYVIKQFDKVFYKNKYIYLYLLLFILTLSLALALEYFSLIKENVWTNRCFNLLYSDERSIFNIFCALNLFLFVYHLPKFSNKIINFIAGCTLDIIIIIHDSGLLRQQIWHDLFKSQNYYLDNSFYIWLITVTAIIFAVSFVAYIIRYYIMLFLFKYEKLDNIANKLDEFCYKCIK